MSNPHRVHPRIIIHGGAGNIKRSNLTPEAYEAHRAVLLSILDSSYALLLQPGATALDVATHAVALLEDNPMFNAGHGGIFTTAGTHELEASVMVSRGYRKRGVGIMQVNRVKNPIKLAREMLMRGEEVNGGGAGMHCQLAGDTVHQLARKWGLEMVDPSYYWTKKRWDEHRRGLGKSTSDETYRRKRREADDASYSSSEEDFVYAGANEPSWDGKEYLPQGTVGCVVLDSMGTLCTATSTGGYTNKLPGRIGDTPTLGAGFFAEEWLDESYLAVPRDQPKLSPAASIMRGDLYSVFRDCLPGIASYLPVPTEEAKTSEKHVEPGYHGVAISGTGNGDSFLRISAARTACALTRFTTTPIPLSASLNRVAGPKGMLEQSAEGHWAEGEGQGGMIGIEVKDGKGTIAADLNCGGMFRTWVDDNGVHRMRVFRDDGY